MDRGIAENKIVKEQEADRTGKAGKKRGKLSGNLMLLESR